MRSIARPGRRHRAAVRRIDQSASGKNLIVTRTNQDVMAALNEAFDTLRRSVVEEADKRRQR